MSDTPDPDYLARLERAIAKLPHMQREVFMAHRLDGLSYSQIACWKSLTRKTVQKLMVRAIVNIDRQLEGHRLRWWQRIW